LKILPDNYPKRKLLNDAVIMKINIQKTSWRRYV